MKISKVFGKAFRSKFKTRAATLLLVLGGLLAAMPNLQAQARRCQVDREMWTNGGGDGFGANGVHGQTFTITAPGQVCKIELRIFKSDPGGGDLLVVLRDSHLNPIPFGTAIIHGADIPLGHSVQTIEFCCNQMPVLPAGGPAFYGLTVAAPTSAPNAYTWVNNDVGGQGAFPFGSGYGNVNGAAPNTPWIQVPYDYAFKLYMCRP